MAELEIGKGEKLKGEFALEVALFKLIVSVGSDLLGRDRMLEGIREVLAGTPPHHREIIEKILTSNGIEYLEPPHAT